MEHTKAFLIASTVFIISLNLARAQGSCPAATCTYTASAGNNYTVTTGETICINNGVNYNNGTITLNGGTIFIASGGTLNIPDTYSDRVNFGSTSARAIKNCGTLTFSATATIDITAGSSGNGLTITNYVGGTLTTSHGAGNSFYVRAYNSLVNYGTMNFSANLNLSDQNGSVINYYGGTLTVGGKLDIDHGTLAQSGSITAVDMELRNNASALVTMYDASVIRVTSNLFVSAANKVTYGGSAGSCAYFNYTGGSTTNGTALANSSNIKYCGPAGQNVGSATNLGTSCTAPTCNLLPIVLSYFDAKPVGSKVEVTWLTASEINNDYFTIERSLNGFDFDPIGFVKGAGNSNQLLSYTFEDPHPLPGLSYYRLRQTDYDGKEEIFRMKAVQFYKYGGLFTIFTNSAGNEILIKTSQEFNYKGIIKVELKDVTGRSILEKQVKTNPGNNFYIVENQSNISKGVYLLQVSYDGKFYSDKICIE